VHVGTVFFPRIQLLTERFLLEVRNCASFSRPPTGEVTRSNSEQTFLNATECCCELLPKADDFLLVLVLMQLSSLRNLTRVCLHVVVHGVEERERERGERA